MADLRQLGRPAQEATVTAAWAQIVELCNLTNRHVQPPTVVVIMTRKHDTEGWPRVHDLFDARAREGVKLLGRYLNATIDDADVEAIYRAAF